MPKMREAPIFNPTQIVIQAFVEQLRDMYGQTYGILEPAYPDIIASLAASPLRILQRATRESG